MTLAEILEKKFDVLEFDEVVEFCKQGIPEGVQLDYKKEMVDITKHLAAFSNMRGGVILFGVDESTGVPKTFEGLELSSRIDESITQMATSIDPVPVFDIYKSTIKHNRQFIIVRILEGNAPPYYVKNKGYIYVRTGNITNPVDQASPEQIRQIFAKKEYAFQTRNNNRVFSNDVYFGELKRAEEERKSRVIAKTSSLIVPLGTNSATVRFEIQPFLADRPLIENEKLREIIINHHVYRSGGLPYPDSGLEYKPIPGGISAFLWRDWGKISNIQLFANGYFSTQEEALELDSESDHSFARMLLICRPAIFGLRFAKNLYKQLGYCGNLVLNISVHGLQNARLYSVLEGPTHGHPTDVVLMDNYTWQFETDTLHLDGGITQQELELQVVRDLHWSMGIDLSRLASRVKSEYLEQI